MSLLKEKTKFLIILFINVVIFGIVNIMFDVKYEQVDDFIIYNLYSGLDGTYNFHGIYIHPFLCILLNMLYRISSIINWHSVFLLIMQFLCFSLIGFLIVKKHNNGISIILYTIFASIFYPTLLMLVQYTSVSALLLLTSFILLVDRMEQKDFTNKKYELLLFLLFTFGIMLRLQSLLIILPFMGIYFILYMIEYFKKNIEKQHFIKMIFYYIILFIITVIIYITNLVIYHMDPVYREYTEFNTARSALHDIIHIDYEKNKEIFDEIGWSSNDFFMFNTFNFGDENIYTKENIKKLLGYMEQKDEQIVFTKDLEQVLNDFKSEMSNTYIYISILFFSIFLFSLFNGNKIKYNVLLFIITIAIHLLFIGINRSMLRVVIPEYILSTALILYNIKLNCSNKINDSNKNCAILIMMIIMICYSSCTKYNYNYKLGDYQSSKDLISYTNAHKENVYLYTVPSLQFRYLAYSVYQMPPKNSFSNLRVLGGWDMYTQNYYDFKERFDLDGTFLDLLKDNVYLVDGDVFWSGVSYHNYKANIFYAIKQHYDIDVECKEIEQFDNLKIYKVYAIKDN